MVASTGYGMNIKIFNMGFDRKTEDFLYEAIQTRDFYDRFNLIIRDFKELLIEKSGYKNINIGANGRSGGYLVLYYNRTDNYADQTYDEDELQEMDKWEVKDIYDLLKEFDKLKQIIKKEGEYLVKHYKVIEEEIPYTKMEKVMQAV